MMEKEEIDRIYFERMLSWRNICLRENATPIVMIAVKHDYRAGIPVVIALEDIEEWKLAKILRNTAKLVEGR